MTTVFYIPKHLLNRKTLQRLEGVGDRRARQIMAEIKKQFNLHELGVISLANYAMFRGFDYQNLKAHIAQEGKPARYVIRVQEIADLLECSERSAKRKIRAIKEKEGRETSTRHPISFNQFCKSGFSPFSEEETRQFLRV